MIRVIRKPDLWIPFCGNETDICLKFENDDGELYSIGKHDEIFGTCEGEVSDFSALNDLLAGELDDPDEAEVTELNADLDDIIDNSNCECSHKCIDDSMGLFDDEQCHTNEDACEECDGQWSVQDSQRILT